MTRTLTGPDFRSMPRFTFAGRGCRDSRREPRRLPHSHRLQQPAPTTAPPIAAAPSEPGRPPAGRPSTRPSGAAASPGSSACVDHPPPELPGGDRSLVSAFVYRDRAEMERRKSAAARVDPTGVRLPG